MQNNKMKVQQRILTEESTDKELIYELGVTNLGERKTNVEVAFAIDNSYSMSENTDVEVIKQKIKNLTSQIISQVSRVTISVSNNSARGSLSNNNTTVQNAIQNINFAQATPFSNAATYAMQTFTTNEDCERYIILITDATDKIGENFFDNVPDDVQVISILYDMTNNETGTAGDGRYGPVYMFNEFTEQEIVDSLNRSFANVKITNKLTENILKYFDKVEIINKNDNDTITENEKGFEWNINRIPVQTTSTLKYRLTLKDDVFLNEELAKEIIYKDWKSSEEVKIEYKDYYQRTQNFSLLKDKTPTFSICETYKVRVRAVNEKNTYLGIEGIEFEIKGKDKNGDIVYDKTVTTDSEGYVTIEQMKKEGKTEYTIKPIVNIYGYQQTDTKTVTIDNAYFEDQRPIKVLDTDLKHKENIEKRIVEVEVPIRVKSFDLEINLTELHNKNVKVSNTEFRLIQPKLNSKYEMDALYGKTDENGKLLFEPAVMTKDGTYDYILSQMNVQNGYETMGNVTLRVTFKNGNAVAVKKLYNDNVEEPILNINEQIVVLNVANKNVLENGFDFELELSDDIDSNKKLNGAVYTVQIVMPDNTTYTYGSNVTDNNGKINLKLPGPVDGIVRIKVTEERPALGYKKSNSVKEFTVRRKDGRIDGNYRPSVNSSASNYFTITFSEPDEKVIMKTTSIKKEEKNIVKIKAVDMGEGQSLGLMNVEFELINITTGDSYNSIYTDENGIAEFEVNERQGTYNYRIVPLDIPYGYTRNTAKELYNRI